MGCLLSRRRQGDGGLETAVPLLPRKQEKCWTLKKLTYSYTAVFIFILCVCARVCVRQNEVCCFMFMRTDTFRCEKHPKNTFISGGLSLWLVSLKVLCHIQRSQKCSAVTLILSKNSQLKTKAPSWDRTELVLDLTLYLNQLKQKLINVLVTFFIVWPSCRSMKHVFMCKKKQPKRVCALKHTDG